MANTKQKIILKFKDDEFVERLSLLLVQAGKVKVTGLGIFEVRHVAAREGYNVANAKRITIPAHKKIVFRPAKSLREVVQLREDS